MATDVQPGHRTGTNPDYGDGGQEELEICSVLHCPHAAASLLWPTEDTAGGWPITWAVCSFHYWHLDGGKPCIKVNEHQPSTNRWLLMDDDLETVNPEWPSMRTSTPV